MTRILKFSILILSLLAFTNMDSSAFIKDYRFVKNVSLIDDIRRKIENKQKNNLYNFRYLYNASIFALDKSNPQKVFVLISVFKMHVSEFIKAVAIPVEIVNFKGDIFKLISGSESEKTEFKIGEIKFPNSKDNGKFTGLSYIKNYLGLKKYINFERDGRVYYTVPSGRGLDDLHMIYESKDGNEQKEFVFTKSGIIPIEDTISWKLRNSLNGIKNLFSFKSDYNKEKNNNDFLNEEQKKLKVD